MRARNEAELYEEIKVSESFVLFIFSFGALHLAKIMQMRRAAKRKNCDMNYRSPGRWLSPRCKWDLDLGAYLDQAKPNGLREASRRRVQVKVSLSFDSVKFGVKKASLLSSVWHYSHFSPRNIPLWSSVNSKQFPNKSRETFPCEAN